MLAFGPGSVPRWHDISGKPRMNFNAGLLGRVLLHHMRLCLRASPTAPDFFRHHPTSYVREATAHRAALDTSWLWILQYRTAAEWRVSEEGLNLSCQDLVKTAANHDPPDGTDRSVICSTHIAEETVFDVCGCGGRCGRQMGGRYCWRWCRLANSFAFVFFMLMGEEMGIIVLRR